MTTSNDEAKTVAGLKFSAHDPTEVALEKLYHWVIWQYPRRKGKGYYGAVRPPTPDEGWYPAIVHADQQRVLVYIHVPEPFPSPEAASKHLESLPA